MDIAIKKLPIPGPGGTAKSKTVFQGVTDFLNAVHTQSEFVGDKEEIIDKLIPDRHQGRNVPYGIYSNHRPVGFFILSCENRTKAGLQNQETACWLESLMISDSHQGKGLARESLKRLPAVITRDFPNIRRLNLTVNLRNEIAISLYLKTGFTDTGGLFYGGPVGPQHIFTMELKDGR